MQKQKLMRFLRALQRGLDRIPCKRAIALVLMTAVTVATVAPVMADTKKVSILEDGVETVQFMRAGTALEDPRGFLLANGRDVDENDKVEVSSDGSTIVLTLLSGYEVSVKADGQTLSTVAHYGDTAQDALTALSVTLGENDTVEPALSEALSGDTAVTVSRFCRVTARADGREVTNVVPKGTVEQSLVALGVTLGDEDIVTPERGETATDGQEITVARVTYEDVSTTAAVSYETVKKDDKTRMQGYDKVQTKGRNGEKTVVTRNKMIDGEVVESAVVSETVTTAPVNEVVLVGVKKPAKVTVNGNGTITDASGKTVRYKKVISGRCSAYTGGGTTSTGLPAAVGRIAVNPKVIPYGTRLYVCSPDGKIVYGYAVAADTGGGLMSGRIIGDLYYNTVAECRQFGSRTMNLYILD